MLHPACQAGGRAKQQLAVYSCLHVNLMHYKVRDTYNRCTAEPGFDQVGCTCFINFPVFHYLKLAEKP